MNTEANAKCNSNNRSGYLTHCPYGGIVRIKAVVAHVMFHGLNNDDGVVNDQTYGQNHGKQRQGVDRKPEGQKSAEGSR